MNQENTPPAPDETSDADGAKPQVHALPSADAVLAASFHSVTKQIAPSPRIELPRVYSDALTKVVSDWLMPLQESFRQIGQLIQQVQAEWAPVIQSLRPVIQAMASIDWDAWWASQRAAFLATAKHGWFIQPEMAPDVFLLTTDGDLLDGFEATFIAMLKSELEAIEARLVDSFPKRAHLIKEGFALQREERYYSAIPMFLNCAEGIVQELTNESPFSTQGTAPEVAEWVKRLPLAQFEGLLAEALAVKHPLSQHSGHSRHRINHGRSLDYGTELSSLKAISFLGFVGWLFCPKDGPLASAAEEAGWEFTSRGWKPRRTRAELG